MNGATAEPSVNMTSPPNTTIMTKIGSIQNFLRTRMKVQSSPRKASMACPQNWFFMVSGFGPGGARSIQ